MPTGACDKGSEQAAGQNEQDVAKSRQASQRLVGRRLVKRFGKKLYSGTVTRWDAATGYLSIRYDDSDVEELSEDDLEPLLLPEGEGEGECKESETPPKRRRTEGAGGCGATREGKGESQDGMAPLRHGMTCLALSGFHTEQKRHYTDVIYRLKAAKSRKSDQHAWDDEVTHLVMPELRRMEKTVAAMAAGVWLLSANFLDCSLAEGRLLDEVRPPCHCL